MKTLSLKKFLACLMATLVILASMSVSIATAETAGDFEYEIYENYDQEPPTSYAVITKYNGSAANLTVPSQLDGYNVKEIDGSAFIGNTNLTSVTIPDSITSIGDWTFKNCTNLSVLNLPDTLESVGCGIVDNTALSKDGNNWDVNLLYIGKYLIDADYSVEGAVEVKEGTEHIASMVFCFKDITSLKLPESLKVIDTMAFSNCDELTSVKLPSKLETIGGFAFSDCTGLTEITVPASVKTIGYNAFNDCTSLKSVTLPEGITEISSGLFDGCESLKSFTLPSTVKYIDFFAFEDSGIETFNITKNVDYVGSEAFADCENLTAITVENGNENYFAVDGVLYENTFYGTIDLHTYPAGKAGASFTVPEEVEYIDSYAFAGVKNLKALTLNDKVYGGKFYYASSIEAVEVPEANEALYDIDGVVFDKETNMLVYYPSGKQGEKYTVPAGTIALNPSAISDNNSLTEITVPEGVDSLEYSAIYMCENLKTVNLPSTLTYVDSYAIDECDNLTTINFNGTKAQWDAFETDFYTNSTEGLYLNCTDGTFELVAPYEEETDFTQGDTGTTPPTPDDFTDPSEPSTGTTATDPTEPTATTPEGSTSTDPTEGDTGTTPPAELAFDLGDVNMDSKLNIRDATAIQKHLAKLATLSDEALVLADYNVDGKVNVRDATTIQKKIAGLI